MPDYVRGIDVERRPWQRRIEVYSPKLGRRVTHFSRTAYEAWLLLESDPTIKTFCERPAYLDDQAQRVIDFWVNRGRHASFWLLATDKAEHVTWPQRVHELPLRVIRREELVAQSIRVQNWSRIVPYLASFARHLDPRLQQDVLGRLAKPHRLERLEASFHPLDAASVRAAVFTLLAAGDVVAPELERTPLGPTTVFKRAGS